MEVRMDPASSILIDNFYRLWAFLDHERSPSVESGDIDRSVSQSIPVSTNGLPVPSAVGYVILSGQS
jgi:hypothetical protein